MFDSGDQIQSVLQATSAVLNIQDIVNLPGCTKQRTEIHKRSGIGFFSARSASFQVGLALEVCLKRHMDGVQVRS